MKTEINTIINGKWKTIPIKASEVGALTTKKVVTTQGDVYDINSHGYNTIRAMLK